MWDWIWGLSRSELVALGGSIVGINLLGALPAVFFSTDTDWIEQPWFYPPEIVFPVVWTLLFSLLGVAFFLVWQTKPGRKRRLAVTAFAVQFALNLAWTPAFFGLQRLALGLVIIGALWVAILINIVAFDRVSRPAAALLVPYLAWVSFACALNYAIYTSG